MEVAITAPKKEVKKKTCTACKNELPHGNFYISKSPMFALDGRVPICKSCTIANSLNEDGSVNEIELNKVLRQIDKPYYKNYLQAAYNQFRKEYSYVDENDIKSHGKEILQYFFKNIAMRQTINKSYCDSEKEGFMFQNSNTAKSEKQKIKNNFGDINSQIGDSKEILKTEETIVPNDNDFEITPSIVELFGDGYSKTIYKKMYDKYEKLKMNYSIQTNLHQEALATYVRFKVQEEVSTAKGDVADAQKWYSAAQDAADKAKLTPKQLTQADLQGGINSFSEIFKAVEQAVDVIPILPRFKYRPNDALDFNIWCYINYARDLQGLPQCSYEDVYKFYDKKKQEYLEQYGDPYGIFEDEPTEKNRPNVEKFITLPKDYEEGDE